MYCFSMCTCKIFLSCLKSKGFKKERKKKKRQEQICGPTSHMAGLVVTLGALDSDTSGFKSRLGHLEALCPGQASVSSSVEWEGCN